MRICDWSSDVCSSDLVMPVVGDDVPLEPGDPKKPGTGYRQHFDHQTEIAQRGYYAVTLTDSKVRAEMTAGTPVGVHRYNLPAGTAAHLVLDLRTTLPHYRAKETGGAGCRERE